MAQAQAVVVGQAAPAAELPEIPKETRDCLLRSAAAERKRAKNADGAIEIGDKVDRTKISCAQIHLKWYEKLREQRGSKVAVVEEKPAPADKKKKPVATWE